MIGQALIDTRRLDQTNWLIDEPMDTPRLAFAEAKTSLEAKWNGEKSWPRSDHIPARIYREVGRIQRDGP